MIKTEVMEDNENLIESLLERVVDYGKTRFEITKLKVLDKTLDVVSSVIPRIVIFVLIAFFILFINLGLAFWLGRILGEIWLGFFVVAGFYGITGIVICLFLQKWLKKVVGNYIIKQLIK